MVASRIVTTTIVKGADYLMDMELISPSEKREIDNVLKRGISETRDGLIDVAYASFLDDLLEFWEAKFDFEEEEEDDDDDDDPTYMMFLDNLKEHGNSYMLDVSLEHGVSSPIKYEVEDDSPYELKRKPPRGRSCSLVKERRNLNVDSVVKSRTETVDKGYERFMRGLKVVRESVFYDSGDGQRVYYETSDQERSMDAEINPRKEAPRRPTPPRRQPTTPLRQSTPAPRQLSTAPRQPTVINRIQTVTPRQPTSSPIQPTVTPRIPTVTPRQPTPTPRIPTVTPRIPTMTPRQPTAPPATNNNRNMISISNKKVDLWFKDKLRILVKKPYERQEYEDFLQKVHARKPIALHKETRTGGYNYKAEQKMGNSYLDTYSDLKREIEQVKVDRLKVLNLLRGFFLYLQSVPHGVSPPWKNEDCMRIMLGSV